MPDPTFRNPLPKESGNVIGEEPCAWCGTPTTGRRERPPGVLTPCCVDCLLRGVE